MSSICALDTMRAFTREDDVILLKSGEVLFRPGETGTTMFGLLEGAIRITWIGQAGQNGHEDIPVCHVFGQGHWSWKVISGFVWQRQPWIAA